MRTDMKISNILACVSLIGFIVCIFLINGLKKDNAQLFEDNEQLHMQIQNNRKVYVYNLETVLSDIGAAEAKQKFEKDVDKLNKEVIAAEKKIKNIKDAKAKAEFSEVYFKSLRLKRDNLVEDYNKSLQELLKKINKALAQTATDKNVATIFSSKSVAVTTEDVIDVSADIVKTLKAED